MESDHAEKAMSQGTTISYIIIIIMRDTDPEWDGCCVSNQGKLTRDIKEAATFPRWAADALVWAFNQRRVGNEVYESVQHRINVQALFLAIPSNN